MRAGEPDALDAGYFVHRLEEAGEGPALVVRRGLMIDDLSEQLNLAPTLPGGVPHLGEDVGPGAHPLVSARVRHHAEAAELVTAFDDGHIRLHGVAAPRDAKRPAHIIVRLERDRRTAVLRRLFDQHGQPANRLRADDDVGDAGRAFEQRLAFLLRHASGDRHDGIVAGFERLLAELAESRIQLVFRVFANAAGVDDDEIGLGRILCELKTGLLEQSGHALGVVHVHLAAEGFDVVLARHGQLRDFLAGWTFALSLSPFAWRRSPSISRAEARMPSVNDVPPSIRDSSSTRPAVLRFLTVVRLLPPSTCFSMWKWASAYAAMCGRCVMHSPWNADPSVRSHR